MPPKLVFGDLAAKKQAHIDGLAAQKREKQIKSAIQAMQFEPHLPGPTAPLHAYPHDVQYRFPLDILREAVHRIWANQTPR
jgi:hypothetical protein